MQNTTTRSEQEISAGFQRGERWAFDAAAREHFMKITNFASHLLRNRDKGMELAQEAFFLACRAHKQVDPNRPLLPWLFQITRNLAYKEFNRRAKAQEISLEQEMEEGTIHLPSNSKSPMEESERADLKTRIDRAIKRLKPKLRDILLLRMVQGLPSEQVSQIMDLPVATVNTRTHRALLELRRLCAQEGIREDEVF